MFLFLKYNTIFIDMFFFHTMDDVVAHSPPHKTLYCTHRYSPAFETLCPHRTRVRLPNSADYLVSVTLLTCDSRRKHLQVSCVCHKQVCGLQCCTICDLFAAHNVLGRLCRCYRTAGELCKI
jgi:hypothetical protein